MSATAAPDGKDEGAAIKVQLPTTDQKDQPTGYPAPPETTHPEFPAANTALNEAYAQTGTPPQTTPLKKKEVASEDGDAVNNAADERANKADTEETLEDPSKSTTSACQAPWAHLHQEAQGKLYIKARGKAPRLSRISATRAKMAASLGDTAATKAAPVPLDDPYMVLHKQWYDKIQSNKAEHDFYPSDVAGAIGEPAYPGQIHKQYAQPRRMDVFRRTAPARLRIDHCQHRTYPDATEGPAAQRRGAQQEEEPAVQQRGR